MESIVHEQMMSFLLKNNLISDHQHGFLAQRSTCTNLLDSTQDWILALKDRANIDVAFIDFAKAFDSVSHPKLLHKLVEYGFQHELLNWISTFLDNRTQRVLVDGHLSESVRVRSGVVQGSVLGPLLFILFINDVIDQLGSASISKLFADDMKLYTRVKLNEPSALADGLAKLEVWSKNWQLRINEKKCAVMHLGNQLSVDKCYISDFVLPSVNRICDLGISYDDKLCFRDHIGNITSKAYQRIYLIFRCFVSRNIDLLKRAFTTYIRPLLEYCTPLWSPYLIKDVEKIENVQRYFTRRLLSSDMDYTGRLKLLGLDSLELRRLKFDLKLYYQIINGLINLNCSKFFQILPVTHETRSHKLQIQKQVYQNNSLNNTFPNRAVDCWNSLPKEKIEATDFKTFKRMLNVADSSIFYPYMKLQGWHKSRKACPTLYCTKIIEYWFEIKNKFID